MAERISEPPRTPEEIRAKVVRMLDSAYKIIGTNVGASFTRGAAWELERLLRWIDGQPEDAWDDESDLGRVPGPTKHESPRPPDTRSDERGDR